MPVKLLAVEDLKEADDLLRNPSWDVVSGFVRRLDGTTVTYMYLYKTEKANDDEYLLVGGGGEYYICEYVCDGKSYRLLNKDDETSEELISFPVENTEEFPKKYCIAYEEVLPNVKYFYEHGDINPEYKWDKRRL